MTAYATALPLYQFFDANGDPLVGGKLYSYEAGTTTPLATYTDSTGTVPNTNPIILDSNGQCQMWLGLNSYKFNLMDSADVQQDGWPLDNIQRDSSADTLKSNLADPTNASLGDAMIAVKQPFIGSVHRTQHDKNTEIVSAKDFGAKGDGSDDTAAIQAAINYCTNLSNRRQRLYFPANSPASYYKITSPLVIPGRLTLVGDGEFSTTIYASGFSAGQYILDFTNQASDGVYYGGVENMRIQGDTVNANGIRLNNASYWLIKNVSLFNLGVGMLATGTACFSNFFEQVTGYGISSSTMLWDSFTGGGQYVFNGCTFTGSDGVMVSSNSVVDSIGFVGCNFEQCVTTDAYINGSVSGLVFDNCRSEGLDGTSSLLISPSAGKFVRGLSVTGCNWTSDFGNAYAVDISGDVAGFSISGNTTANTGFLSFVRLNGAGKAGSIFGNYIPNSPAVVNAARDGVVVYANQNSSGALPEYWGSSTLIISQGSYTATATGMTTSPTGTVAYSIAGKTVTIDIPTISGTSNSSSLTLTGLPASLRPTVDKDILTKCIDNGAGYIGFVRVKTTGVMEFYKDISGAGFTSSGTKAITPNSISYTMV